MCCALFFLPAINVVFVSCLAFVLSLSLSLRPLDPIMAAKWNSPGCTLQTRLQAWLTLRTNPSLEGRRRQPARRVLGINTIVIFLRL